MIKIKMYTDFAWPFCYLGKGVVESFKDEFNLSIEVIPCESKPNTKSEGEKIGPAKGMAVGMLLKQLRSSGKKYNITFADMSFEANSRNALLVQLLASEKGLSNPYSTKVYKSFFEESVNISLAENILEIGLSVGLSEDDMMKVMNSEQYLSKLNKNLVDAKNNDITKFPTFVINEEHKIIGSPNEKKLRAILESI